MAKGYPSINLLRPRSVLLDEIVDWALNIGRLLVIATEIIALSMFLYRFVLDRQILDLRDKIAQERQIIAVFKEREETFRNLQNKLNFTSDMINAQAEQQKLLKTITAAVPADASLTSVSVATKSANIFIGSQNVSSLKEFVEILKKDKQFESVTISLVDTNPSKAQISLGILATLKKE
jgi:Tfp pilus assembly protein PilN